MPRRAARAPSPAQSEPELDILGSLYPGDDEDGARGAAAGIELDIDGILDVPHADDDGDDEAFIALQQAASYRKASNLKGKTVKKGGGFQAMGKRLLPPCPVWTPSNNTNAPPRSQFQPAQGHHEERLFSAYAYSEENDTIGPRQERRCRHGKDGFRKDGGIRDTHDRETSRT